MTKTADYTISLIRALVQEQPVPPVPEGLSLQELFDFSRSHSIEALIFRELCPLIADPDDPVWKQWENRVNLLLAQSIVQLQARDDIIRNLTAAGIDVMPVKGCWLKERYPDINDRQMSDLDMLIHLRDAALAERVLLSMGYRKEEVCFHHTAYLKPPYTEVELHVFLLPETDEHAGYYQNIWEKAIPVEGTPRLYMLKPEDEYLFYLVHLSSHLSESGSGIRSILDNCIYARCFPNMDAVYLEGELKTLGLLELSRQVQALSRCWFETGQAIPDELEPLAQEVCAAGTYGYLEMRTHHRMERLSKTYRNPVIRVFAYCLPRFFCPLSEMRRNYLILEKAPVLLPVFWVVRMISMMLHGKSFWQHLRSVFGEGGRHG
ncbi:MAG: nucleotidyltransferase family protein [Bacillota bacterium]|nr:nucleotidyltransferase family protein [Bacillota bacterium]